METVAKKSGSKVHLAAVLPLRPWKSGSVACIPGRSNQRRVSEGGSHLPGCETDGKRRSPARFLCYSPEKLLPFAALHWGKHHPDGMNLTDGNVDLLGFYYESNSDRPRVVVWIASEAQKEHWRWEKALEKTGWKEDVMVRYQDFTIPVAPNFEAFLELLRIDP